jgi:phosphoribosyl 1,2-cyclic phosphodiesterase
VKITLWGTRGSLATPGEDTVRYGGNTSCVEVTGTAGTRLVLDAGTGVRRLGANGAANGGRIDLLLSHLHMDHIQGLGFFQPLFEDGREVHIWGPASTTTDLRERLARYLSPPLFPVSLRELPCELTLHNVPLGEFQIGEFRLVAQLVCHPGPTVGYRITNGGGAMTYLPDHEPALGAPVFPNRADWTSGFNLAEGVDLLIHDAQYTEQEYPQRIGWGHSSLSQTLCFATLAGVRRLMTFHHDPSHPDTTLDAMLEEARGEHAHDFEIIPGCEGASVEV